MKTVFNEAGEPIGTERDPDPDEMYDMYDDEPDIDDCIDDCYYCGKTYNCDAMIWHEIEVNGVIKEVGACGNCEYKIP